MSRLAEHPAARGHTMQPGSGCQTINPSTNGDRWIALWGPEASTSAPVGFDALPCFAGGDEHRVPDRGERRGVGEVGIHQVVDACLMPQGHGEDVDAFGRTFLAYHLRAEQAPGAALGDDLGADRLGSRVGCCSESPAAVSPFVPRRTSVSRCAQSRQIHTPGPPTSRVLADAGVPQKEHTCRGFRRRTRPRARLGSRPSSSRLTAAVSTPRRSRTRYACDPGSVARQVLGAHIALPALRREGAATVQRASRVLGQLWNSSPFRALPRGQP